jgi:hypothetical protein
MLNGMNARHSYPILHQTELIQHCNTLLCRPALRTALGVALTEPDRLLLSPSPAAASNTSSGVANALVLSATTPSTHSGAASAGSSAPAATLSWHQRLLDVHLQLMEAAGPSPQTGVCLFLRPLFGFVLTSCVVAVFV